MDWFRATGVLSLAAVFGGAGWFLHPDTQPVADVARLDASGPARLAQSGVQGPDDKPLVAVSSDGQVTLRVEQQPLEWVLEQIALQSGVRQTLATVRGPAAAASASEAGTSECLEAPAPALLVQQQVTQLLQAIRQGSEQERVDGLMQAREGAVALPDDALKTLFETDASEHVRLRAFEAYLERRSGSIEEMRSALQAAQFVPSAAIQAEAKAQLQQLQDYERIDAASGQQSDP